MTRRQAPETGASRPEKQQAIRIEADAAAHVMRGLAETPAAIPNTSREEMRRFGDGLSSLNAQQDGALTHGVPSNRHGKVRIRRL